MPLSTSSQRTLLELLQIRVDNAVRALECETLKIKNAVSLLCGTVFF
jgi:hypothetical protein